MALSIYDRPVIPILQAMESADPHSWKKQAKSPPVSEAVILLMEEILHHLGYINLINNGINYISTGAGFLPSTLSTHFFGSYHKDIRILTKLLKSLVT